MQLKHYSESKTEVKRLEDALQEQISYDKRFVAAPLRIHMWFITVLFAPEKIFSGDISVNT